jgi:asparagine synthase (glutamine-hydrolysing)
VVLARDRLGVAPLYVSSVPGGGVAFASTTWALEEAGLTSGELWLRGLCGFLFYGSVPEPLTLTRGLEELPPATWARLGPAGEVERRVFWRFPPEEGGHVPAGEAARRVREALADAVRAEQVSDVPVAVLLSSGLDSTAVAALAAQSALGPPQTFTVGIDDEGPGAVDESGMAAETARSLGLPHATVRADVRGGGEALRQALAAQDLPSVDGTNTYLVSRAIRGAGYKVALSGLGGDELFLGYVNRVNYRRLEGWEAPWWLARWGQAAVTALGRLGLPARVERALAAGLSPRGPLGAYAAIRTIRAPGGVARALHPDLRASLEPEDLDATSYLDGAGLPADPDGALSRLELKHYLRWTLLKDSNQLSLCSGLELRVPLVDARLVEVVLSLPGRVRAQGPPPKPLLRAALAGVLPPGIERRPKRGFVLPLGRWLEGAPDLEDTTREGGLLDARAPRGDLPARLSRAALKAWRARTRWVQGTGCAVM